MAHTSESLQAWLGYLFFSEVKALKQLAVGLRRNPIVVNLGSGAGTSGMAFKESRPDLTLITVDIQDASSPLGCLEAERTALQEAGFKLGQKWYQVHRDSKRFGNEWGIVAVESGGHVLETNISVDMVFVDGDHSYEGCHGDIQSWLPNLRPGGIMAIHDYRKAEAFAQPDDGNKRPHPQEWEGVDRAVDELLTGKYPVVLHVDSLIAFQIGEKP